MNDDNGDDEGHLDTSRPYSVSGNSPKCFLCRVGIKSVVNLQVPGEHASCSAVPLHSSGFSYDPTYLMENGSKL